MKGSGGWRIPSGLSAQLRSHPFHPQGESQASTYYTICVPVSLAIAGSATSRYILWTDTTNELSQPSSYPILTGEVGKQIKTLYFPDCLTPRFLWIRFHCLDPLVTLKQSESLPFWNSVAEFTSIPQLPFADRQLQRLLNWEAVQSDIKGKIPSGKLPRGQSLSLELASWVHQELLKAPSLLY